jgi:hypothetical protein
MGAIYSNNTWPEQIYRLQVTDPIAGGEDGATNIQPIQITNRTGYLKSVFLNEHNEDGTHNITNLSIAEDAEIPEKNLTLDVPTADLNKALEAAKEQLSLAQTVFGTAYGSDGKYVQGLLKQTNLTWQYSDQGFAFELFHEGFTLRTIEAVDVIEAIAKDDSIDIVTSNKYIKEDQSYVVYDNGIEINAVVNNDELTAAKEYMQKIRKGQELLLWATDDYENAEEVKIMSVLEEGRLRATADISKTYHDAKLGHTNWDVHDGYAIAQPNGIYISKLITTFENSPSGTVTVRRDTSAGQLDFYYRLEGTDDWIQVQSSGTTAAADGSLDYTYYLPSGRMYLKLVNNSKTNVKVTSITCAPSMSNSYVRPILTPSLVGISNGSLIYKNQMKVYATRYSSAFRDTFLQTEFRIVSAETGETVMTLVRDLSWDGSEAFQEVTDDKTLLKVPGVYQIQCRHVSDMAYIGNCEDAGTAYGFSDWSNAIQVTILENRQYFAFLNFQPAEFGSPFLTVSEIEPDALNYTMKPLKENIVPFGFYGVEGAGGFDEGFLE